LEGRLKMSKKMKIASLTLGMLLMPLMAEAQNEQMGLDWSGPYLGAHAGWLLGNADYDERNYNISDFDADIDGFQGGLIAGFNHQVEQYVVGFEIDGGVGTADLDAGESTYYNNYISFDLKWNAHIRAKLGYQMQNALFFAAGGLAIAQITTDDVDWGYGEEDSTLVGWTVGCGTELAVNDSLTFRFEYLYDDYGSDSYMIDAPASSAYYPGYTAETSLTAHTFRMAAVFRF